ncbi:MAG TPA: hypothetical protein V6D11_28625 [Waterburya sp.]
MKLINNLLETLKFRWQTLLQPLPVEPELGQRVLVDLVTNYSSANRVYHNLKHIAQVLAVIDALQCWSVNFTALQFAAWFHDVIYDTQVKDNEEKSAEYAEGVLRQFRLPQAIIAQVKALILITKNHQAPLTDIDSQILIDADLAILGSSELEYREYAQAIRQEYAWVSERKYRIGRTQVLQNFLQRDKIYATEQLFTALEERARQNMLAEVATLLSR